MTIVKFGHGHKEEIMGKTILVADNERGIRHLLKDFLTFYGYDPITCEDGEHAVSHISSADILITDFNMPPGMNGAELAKIAKRQKPDMPVIIMTGDPRNIPADHLADQVVEKPFEIGKLKKIINDLLHATRETGGTDD